MDRFNRNFNDVDPETARPFSYGHPDGVWITAIVYSLVLLASLAALVVGIIKAITGDGFAWELILPAFVNGSIFIPAIYWLFRRSEKAIVPIGVAFGLSVIAAFSAVTQGANFYVLIAIVCLQGFIGAYVLGLKKDTLLK